MKPLIPARPFGSQFSTLGTGVSRFTNPQWPSIDQGQEAAGQAQNGVRRVHDINAVRNKHFPVLANLFPFAVYNLPRVLRSSPDDANDWRKFRVHAGKVVGIYSASTDGENTSTDPQQLSGFNSAFDVWAPNSSSSFYFWLECGYSSNVPVSRVLYGPDPTADTYADSASSPSHPWDHTSSPWSSIGDWSNWPAAQSCHLMIANITPDPPNLAYKIIQHQWGDVIGIPTNLQFANTANNNSNASVIILTMSAPIAIP